MIKDFFSAKKLAVAGASRDKKKFGNVVCRELSERGFEISPINPSGEIICGKISYVDVSMVPSDVDHLIIVTRKDQTKSIVDAAIRKNISNIWIQQWSDTPEAIKAAKEAGTNLIRGKCVLMYIDPVKGIHKFHRTISKILGGYER